MSLDILVWLGCAAVVAIVVIIAMAEWALGYVWDLLWARRKPEKREFPWSKRTGQ